MADERYARQVMLPEIGEEGQRRLASSSVLLVGLGGLGSAVAPILAGAGVGRIGLCDHDTVSWSNLPRQTLYTEEEVGRPKCEAALRRLAALSSATRFESHAEGLTPANAERLVAAYDLVVDCCDNFATRYLLDDACAAAERPWVYGSIGPFEGQASLFNHRRGVRYADLYPDREALCSAPRRTLGVLGSVPAAIGAIEATEALKLLAGMEPSLDGRLFVLDLKNMQCETIAL
ncbi:MAG TPA: HesA/MoeB/ThiF family protein [Candidatus Alistipes stercorigallinarum]|nr:HesA/MoeB/ThiF family protein [Candidatus Alistipes stercorigallinarum]